MTPVFLYGAGGHAKVILDLLEEGGRPVQCCFVDAPRPASFLGYPVYGWGEKDTAGWEGIIAIGDNLVRRSKALLVRGPFARVAHRNSYISPRAEWGVGSVAMSGTSIHSGATIGAHCIVNTHASVDHDCTLSDYVHIAPHATLCGGVTVGEGAFIGAGAVVIPGVEVGRWAVVGAGAVIRADVPEGAVVVGNPGRVFLIKPLPL